MNKSLVIVPSEGKKTIGFAYYDSQLDRYSLFSSPQTKDYQTQINFVTEQIEKLTPDWLICSRNNWRDFSHQFKEKFQNVTYWTSAWKNYRKILFGSFFVDELLISGEERENWFFRGNKIENLAEKLAFSVLKAWLSGNIEKENIKKTNRTLVKKELTDEKLDKIINILNEIKNIIERK
ncbi:MAG: hypothetical protein MRERV_17c027 [Mycoplasmataceae bacterium RV_VA103A]|nr:MAG: hypothetical protein MRERV_17c027 [Mycoplasmataceae bacterium RV_VA103A]